MKTQTVETETRGAVACTDLFGDLIRLAAEMARCEGMPSPFVEDWKLPKTTPVKTLRLINETSCKAEDQCKRWAHRLRVLADTLRSPNAEAHRSAPTETLKAPKPN